LIGVGNLCSHGDLIWKNDTATYQFSLKTIKKISFKTVLYQNSSLLFQLDDTISIELSFRGGNFCFIL